MWVVDSNEMSPRNTDITDLFSPRKGYTCNDRITIRHLPATRQSHFAFILRMSDEYCERMIARGLNWLVARESWFCTPLLLDSFHQELYFFLLIIQINLYILHTMIFINKTIRLHYKLILKITKLCTLFYLQWF